MLKENCAQLTGFSKVKKLENFQKDGNAPSQSFQKTCHNGNVPTSLWHPSPWAFQ